MFLRWFKRVLLRILGLKRQPLDLEAYARSLGVKIGKDCRIATINWGTESYLIEIGDHVHVTAGVQFVTHDGSVWVLADEDPDADYFGKIKIGNNVFIEINSTILPNVTIGDNVVVGACSVVTCDIPSNSVAAGSPARVVSTFEGYREKMRGKTMPTNKLDQKTQQRVVMEYFGIENAPTEGSNGSK
jgi:acetyltransferase-like isoleucine patch superfamily enzyme